MMGVKGKLKRWAWVGLLLMALFSGLNGVGAQDQNQNDNQDEMRPLAIPQGAELPLGELAYAADFSTGEWGDGAYDDGSLRWSGDSAGLMLISGNAEAGARFAPPPNLLLRDFYAEVSFKPIACTSPNSAFLFNVRADPLAANPALATAYVFVLQCDGGYRSRFVEGGDSSQIDLRGVRPALTLEQPITFGVLLINNRVTWYAEGQELGSYNATIQPQAGEFALGAQLGLAAQVERFIIWEVEQSESPDQASVFDPLAVYAPSSILFKDEFATPINPLIEIDGEELRGFSIQGVIVLRNVPPTVTRYLFTLPEVDAYYVEVAFQLRQCLPEGLFGLLLGVEGDTAYVVALRCEGELEIFDLENGQTLIEKPLSHNDLTSRSYRLGLVIEDNLIHAYLDDDLIGTFLTERRADLQFGLIWRSAADQSTEVGIDTLQIIELTPPN